MSNFKKARKYHFIYKTTNLINGMYYIGMHSTNKLDDGYVGSGKRLWYSIRKYGIENFKCEILEFLTDRESLANRERELVNEETLLDTKCLNLKKGGNGGFSIEAAKRGAKLGRQAADNVLRKKYGDDYPRIIAKRFHASLTPEKRAMINKNIKNGLIASGYIHSPFKDKKHNADTKRIIGIKNSIRQKGSGNSQFGTCWIHNNDVSKKIKKEDLNTYLMNGWYEGRVKRH